VVVGRGGRSPVLCFPRALEKYILRPILVKNTLHFFHLFWSTFNFNVKAQRDKLVLFSLMCLLDSGRNCVCPCACSCACKSLVCRVRVHAFVYVCVWMYACVWVCCIAIDVHRLAEHYLLCDSERAWEYARHSPCVLSRVACILGAAFFFGVCQKTEFFTLRRNKA